MKSGEDFRRAMGQADDGFVKVIAQVLYDLRMVPPKGRRRRATAVRPERMRAALTRNA